MAAVDQPIIEGPGPPESVPAPPEQRVNGLIPFVHVRDVARSITFYHHLGFIVTSVYKYRGNPAWAELRSEEAVLMVSTGDPVDQVDQGILFYLYSTNLAALREQLLAAGVDVGEIVDGTPGPREQMRLTDPDGYVLMVAQIESPEAG
jgi:catechol 2,3-dioxygenase-like lactoylglutathione lyase family enzyme